MCRVPPAVIALLAVARLPAFADNWISNSDFEADEPALWQGATIERGAAHSGEACLRVGAPPDASRAVSRYADGIEVNQQAPETLMAAMWLRVDATRQTGAVTGGVSFHVYFADDTLLAWYAPFRIAAAQAGSWVYREARYKPRAPVKSIRPFLYLEGCEGAILLDDIYLGPEISLPIAAPRTISLAVTGKNGRFTDWSRLQLSEFGPVANVFHLASGTEANIEFTCEVDVQRPAPAYLTSAWGSQYWTLYSPTRAELAQIYTDERLDLSRPGKHEVRFPMCAFSDMASRLAAGGYVVITNRFKSFLIYGADPPPDGLYRDAKGKTFPYWDAFQVGLLSRYVGPSGVAAPFSLADLTSHRLTVRAWGQGPRVRVRPTLIDSAGNTVPLYGLALSVEARGTKAALQAEIASDGVPTGDYTAAVDGDPPTSVRILGSLALATPKGLVTEVIDQTIPVMHSAQVTPVPDPPGLDLLGWGASDYALSPKPGYGPASMRRAVQDARAAGLTKLLVHARTNKQVLYKSDLASEANPPEWDHLAEAVEAGKRLAVDIYAVYILGLTQASDIEAHPDWAAVTPDQEPTGWYCYNNPEVRAFHGAMLAEIVRRYDVAGVSLDFCRPGGGCFCPACCAGFAQRYGKSLKDADASDADRAEWERDSITDYMRQLAAATRAARPDAKFSGYVWGRLGPDKDRARQDWPRWLAEGIMDFVAVGMYTPSTPMFRAQCKVLRTIADRRLGGDTGRIYPLLGVSEIQAAYPSYHQADAVIGRHLLSARRRGMRAAGFFPFWTIRAHAATGTRHNQRQGR